MTSFNAIKVEFGSELRRLAFDSSTSSWAAVRSQILNSYAVDEKESNTYCLHYLDEEGDLISVNSDSEFAEAVRCAKQKNKIVKFILSKTDKAANTSKPSQEETKQKLTQVAVDVERHSNEPQINVEVADDAGDQQVEEMDLPLSRRDFLSGSPTLSEASDSSFVSINAQSLREDVDEKDAENAVEGVDDAQPSKEAIAVEDDAKVCVPSPSVSISSQPEFNGSDRGIIQEVLMQLSQDVVQFKAESPKEAQSESRSLSVKANNECVHEDQEHVPAIACASPASAVSAPTNSMKVKDLRSVIEGVINEKILQWLDDVLVSVDLLDHADEDVVRIQQLTARIRQGLLDVSDNRQYVQRMSDGVAKKMMRIMKQAEGKLPKNKNRADDLEQKQTPTSHGFLNRAATTPIPTNARAATNTTSPSPESLQHCCGSSSSSVSSDVIHGGITCDGCGMRPIRGVRFHCISCDQIDRVREAGGFDLCGNCESKNVHQLVDGKAHVLIKLKQPTKCIVQVEAPVGPLTGNLVYDVLRVHPDGSRTKFHTPQPVVALPKVESQATLASSEEEKKIVSQGNANNSLTKVDELESRIRVLERLIKDDAEKKAGKREEKQRIRKEKDETKKLKREALAKAKAAKLEAKMKQKEEKAAKAAAAVKKRDDAELAELEAKNKQQDPKNQLQTDDKKEAPSSTASELPANNKVEIKPESSAANAQSSASSTSSASTVPLVPATSATTPFSFSLPQFPFSNMVSSISNTVSNTFASAQFPFGTNQDGRSSTPSAPYQAPALSAASGSPFFSPPAQLAPFGSNASSSSAHVSSFGFGSESSLGKRSLADVRAPAYFPYIAQLRELEAMGFDVDKSISQLRNYRGDVQKAINAML